MRDADCLATDFASDIYHSKPQHMLLADQRCLASFHGKRAFFLHAAGIMPARVAADVNRAAVLSMFLAEGRPLTTLDVEACQSHAGAMRTTNVLTDVHRAVFNMLLAGRTRLAALPVEGHHGCAGIMRASTVFKLTPTMPSSACCSLPTTVRLGTTMHA